MHRLHCSCVMLAEDNYYCVRLIIPLETNPRFVPARKKLYRFQNEFGIVNKESYTSKLDKNLESELFYVYATLKWKIHIREKYSKFKVAVIFS